MTTNHGTSDGSLRWGILGTGLIAGLQTQDLLENGFSVQAVGSRTKDASERFSQTFGIPTAHESYTQLVADPSVDIIYVATPHPFHHEHALLALNAGKHVLVEKPFTMNAREAREVIDLAQQRGLVALEAMWTRFLPHMVRIRQIVADGMIGQLRKVVASHNQSLPTDPTHRLNALELGGGALLDLGIYPVSFAVDLLGIPSSIQASSAMTVTGVDRQTATIFQYPTGEQAMLDCELDAPGANRAVVIGTEGWIDIESVWYTPTAFTVYDRMDNVLERFEQPVTGRGMKFQAAELEQLIQTGHTQSDLLPSAQSIAIMELLDEIRRQIGLRYAADRS